MKTINVNIPDNNYPVYIGKGILSQLPYYIARHIKTRQIALISNAHVFKLYGMQLKKQLSVTYEVAEILVPDGEQAKSMFHLEEIYTGLLQNHFERKSTIVALGGGVAGDLAGYAAASFLRGINLVQVPTTLLAQVDSSIGGKTGINHPMGKNLIGAFKQPAFVLSDIHLLKTLDPPEIRCGLGEVVKYAFIGNPLLFEYLEQNIQNALDGETQVLEHIVSVCSAQKGYVVENDEKESGLRMTLNYGHTFGHALEAHYGYKDLKHGEAIILGMKCALHFSRLNREIDEEDYNRGMALLNRVPVQYDSSLINPQQLLNRMYLDKKVSDKVIRLMLVNKIGECRPVLVSDVELIKKAFEVLI
jgi:3-dehydroquinate synthase